MVNAKAPVSIIDLTVEDPSSQEAEQPQATMELPAATTPPASPPPFRRTRRLRPRPQTDRTERIRRRLFTEDMELHLSDLAVRLDNIHHLSTRMRDLEDQVYTMVRAAGRVVEEIYSIEEYDSDDN